ncbi:MAG: epoxide hydrolase [Congregibacter sp.]
MAAQVSVRDYRVDVPQRELETLRERLLHTRWPDPETADGWNQGLPLAYAQELAAYWASTYDWRRAEAELNVYQQHLVDIDLDGTSAAVHCLHIRSKESQARPLLLTHGWPGSIFEFMKVADRLVDPEAYGGRAEQAFHLVIPSLPGYGFSSKPTATGTNVERIADLWNALMLALDYDRYFAQGGDWGSMVTSHLALRHPRHCAGIHLNMVVARPDPKTLTELSPVEESAVAARNHYAKWETGYSKIQSTRPQTLAYGLADSPVGQLCWIVEKFWAWTDCEKAGVRHPENVLTKDELLDNVTLYWLTNSAASSARLYWESFHQPNLDPIYIPAGGSVFPKDIFLSSERWARGRFKNLVFWREHERGGHFAALEQPEAFTRDLRECFARMSL